MSKNKDLLGYLSVHTQDEKIVHTEPVYVEKRGLWEAYLDNWPSATDKGDLFCFIPVEKAVFRKAIPLPCLFSSVEGYVQSMLGVKLDWSDKKFFEDHPLTGRSGVSQQNTLRVAQEIIDPYNLRISRLQVRPGTMVTGDLKQWMNVLGVNPFALADRMTPNAKFAETTGLPLDDADRMFRFQFKEGLLRPCISCGAYATKDGSRAIGHASYEAPRSRLDNSILQFQIERNVNWDKEPVFGDVEPVDQERDLEMYNSLGKDGRPMYSHLADKNVAQYTRGNLPGKATQKGSKEGTRMVNTPALLGPVGMSTKERKPIRDCFLCGNTTGDRIGANVCVRCWVLYLKEISCGHCGQKLAYNENGSVWYTKGFTLFRRGPDWFFKLKCSACDEQNEVTCTKGSISHAVQAAMRGEDIVDAEPVTRSTQGATH